MLLLICAMMLAFALTACGGSGNDSDTADDTQTEDNSAAGDDTAADDDAAADDTSEDDGAVTGKYASIQEFIESDMMQEQLATQMSSLEGSGMSMELSAEDNKLTTALRSMIRISQQRWMRQPLNHHLILRLLPLNPLQESCLQRSMWKIRL